MWRGGERERFFFIEWKSEKEDVCRHFADYLCCSRLLELIVEDAALEDCLRALSDALEKDALEVSVYLKVRGISSSGGLFVALLCPLY